MSRFLSYSFISFLDPTIVDEWHPVPFIGYHLPVDGVLPFQEFRMLHFLNIQWKMVQIIYSTYDFKGFEVDLYFVELIMYQGFKMAKIIYTVVSEHFVTGCCNLVDASERKITNNCQDFDGPSSPSSPSSPVSYIPHIDPSSPPGSQ